ncbi:hypothetical protein BSL78_08784 [Apostichopus japonicus]|uniref:Uncharacterized protein n=1 Tax=Stichopus japonicus TaxID=307972 RepID=A0A2G8L210_STIJA|nr:hypothetical protein BSL78_08784 [Apostichopus japonicus]
MRQWRGSCAPHFPVTECLGKIRTQFITFVRCLTFKRCKHTRTRHYFILLEKDNAWSIQINVSWTVSGQGYDGYYVDAFLKDSVAFDQYGCDARLGYEYTPQPWYVFSGYQFRHEYEIKIKLFNNATGKNSFSPTTFHVTTPDCYEETGSVEFCASQPIPVSSKVREPRIESVQENIYQNGTDVVVSWLPPVQSMGALRYIALSYRPQDQIPYEGIERYYPSEIEWDGGLETRFISDFPVSKEDIIYVLNIRPYVDIGGNGGSSTSGEDLEIVFNSTIKQVTLTSTTAKEHHWSHFVIKDGAWGLITLVLLSHSGKNQGKIPDRTVEPERLSAESAAILN